MDNLIKILNNIFYNLLLKIILIYQKIISPIIPARCRYYPTCSDYGKQALAWHGVWSGSWLLVKRVGRCHPLGGHGIDFVPLPLASYQYQYLSPERSEYDLSQASSGFPNHNIYRDHVSYTALLNYMLKRQ